jgi:hypothetical protein
VRTIEEFDRLLATAGFRLGRVVDTPTPLSILEAIVEEPPPR